MSDLRQEFLWMLVVGLVACSSSESAHEATGDAGGDAGGADSGTDAGIGGTGGAGGTAGAGGSGASGAAGTAGSSGSAGTGAGAGAAGTAGSGGASTGGSAGGGAAGASGGAGTSGSGGSGAGGSPGAGDGACEPGYDAGVYDPFPGANDDYPTGPVSASLPWVGEDFESYGDGALIEQSSNKSMQPHLNVTSGALYARYVSQYRRGWTTTYNFRVLGVGNEGGDPIRWTDLTVEYRGYIWAWHPTASGTNGLHIFARYQTENDLYVASLRYDGKVTIKKKHCGNYTTLASRDFGIPEVRTWYRLRFEVIGTQLAFSINGNVELTAQDDTFSWGTHGIRTDYADVYLDDWKLLD